MRVFNDNSIQKYLQIAIKQIDKPHIEDRLIGINNLRKIVEQHNLESHNIIQIMTNFIKKNRSLKILNDSETNPISEISADIQAALSIIFHPDIDKYLRKQKIDLSYIDIRGAKLDKANLQKINLQQSILYRASLIDANLEKANLNSTLLSAANFCGANLARSNLSGAILSGANLCSANLNYADLRGANLFLANLQGANLNGAKLEGANLREANFCNNKATGEAQN